MKQVYILLAILLSSTALLSQVELVEEVTIDINDQRTLDAFYDFQQKSSTTAEADNWDISFMNALSSAIRINGGQGVRLWHVTDGSIDDFNQPLDTAGKFDVWEEQFNSTETWDIGAFNMGNNGFSDETPGEFGWGQYSQTVIAGTELFVIKLRNGEYKKIAIDELSSGTFYFFYSDLNNENIENVELSKSSFTGKVNGYYDLENGTEVDREPMTEDWNMVFGKYTQIVQGQGVTQPYPVVGVRTKNNIMVAQLDGVEIVDDKFEMPSDLDYSTSITTIGHDWKELNFSTFEYEMVEGRVYIAQEFTSTQEGENVPVGTPVAIRFTEFAGGKFVFKTNDITLSVNQYDYDENQFAIYPNVVEKGENINMVYSGSDLGAANLNIYSSTGELVTSKTIEFNKNLQISNINANNMSAGVYFVRIESNNSIYTQKFIVK
ncbi:MAG: T9SS type A sorting domain-containing protein [Chlorobiota bacterium]